MVAIARAVVGLLLLCNLGLAAAGNATASIPLTMCDGEDCHSGCANYTQPLGCAVNNGNGCGSARRRNPAGPGSFLAAVNGSVRSDCVYESAVPCMLLTPFSAGNGCTGAPAFGQINVCDQCFQDSSVPPRPSMRISNCTFESAVVETECDFTCGTCNASSMVFRDACVFLSNVPGYATYGGAINCPTLFRQQAFDGNDKCEGPVSSVSLIPADTCINIPGMSLKYLCGGQ